MEGVGDGASRGGLGGHWRPGSLAVTGNTLITVGLGDLWSALFSILVSLFASVPWSLGEDEGCCDVATRTSLSAVRELCGVSLRAKTRKLLCNSDKYRINIRFELLLNKSSFCFQLPIFTENTHKQRHVT